MSENVEDNMQGNVQEYILCQALNLTYGIYEKVVKVHIHNHLGFIRLILVLVVI